jgi:hypothetical protein
MCPAEGDAEQEACPRCGALGLIHEAGCPNRRLWVRLPGAPGPPFSVRREEILEALVRVLDGRSVGEAGGEFAEIAKAIVAQAGQASTRIEIRDNTILILYATDIRGANSISANVSTLAQCGHEEAARGLKEVTEAVTEHLEMAAALRSELLELLDELSRQAVLPRSEQAKPAVIKGILAGLATGLQGAGGLAEVWSTWGPSIQRFFGL